jgi:lysosomal acid lipase/cholesteryl ester hydrolase
MFWLANDADKAPPLILADQGYDVWLGNNRGNRFAKGHVSLSVD